VFENSTHSYFDCKIRKLFITLPVRRIVEVVDELSPVEEKPIQSQQKEDAEEINELAPQG
jgi:hypothetical protein